VLRSSSFVLNTPEIPPNSISWGDPSTFTTLPVTAARVPSFAAVDHRRPVDPPTSTPSDNRTVLATVADGDSGRAPVCRSWLRLAAIR
jgi:hypothetical protein